MSETLSEKLARIGDEAYTNRDDPIPADAKVTRGHNRSRTLQVRLNDEEYAALEAAAEGANLPVSTMVRSLIIQQLEGDEEVDAERQDIAFDTALLTVFISHLFEESEGESVETKIEQMKSSTLLEDKLAMAPKFVEAINSVRGHMPVVASGSYSVKSPISGRFVKKGTKYRTSRNKRANPVDKLDQIRAELDEVRAAVAERAERADA